MSKRIEAIVKPDLLIWARESAGFTKEDAANKLRIKLQRLEDWEAGASRPTIKQLRKLGQLYKRPIAVFYLDEKPTDFQPCTCLAAQPCPHHLETVESLVRV